MAADLRNYVEKGGRLVLNVAQAGTDYACAKGGEVICRLPDGWQVYLVNNGGVTKFGDRAEAFDPKGAEVELDLASLGGAVTAAELFSGERLQVRDGKVRLLVPSGDLRIVDVKKGN